MAVRAPSSRRFDKNVSRCFGLVGLAIVLLSACGGGQQTATSSPSPNVVQTANVPFASDSSGAASYKLDLYSPANAHNLPLVVLFHGGGADKTMLGYPDLARDIAGRGAVVVVPGYGRDVPAPPAAAAIATMKQLGVVASCAVSFAVSHAEEYGADPSRLVLVGHSGGANTALGLALDSTTVSDWSGCMVRATTQHVKALVLWDGDWLLESPDPWDGFNAAEMPVLMAAGTPWSRLENAPSLRVDFMTSELSRESMRRCDGDWLASRDTTGAFRDGLEALGAYADGCIDISEESQLLATTMGQQGLRTQLIPLTKTSHTVLASSDRDLIAGDAILRATG